VAARVARKLLHTLQRISRARLELGRTGRLYLANAAFLSVGAPRTWRRPVPRLERDPDRGTGVSWVGLRFFGGVMFVFSRRCSSISASEEKCSRDRVSASAV